MPYKTWVDGDDWDQDDANFVGGQLVFRFDTDLERDTQLAAPVQGMVSYRNDVAKLETFDGTDWVEVAGGGEPGPEGPIGPQGNPGLNGQDGEGGTVWAGEWGADVGFMTGYVAYYKYSLYQALQNSTGIDPSTETEPTAWVPVYRGLPPGGTTGQVLAKLSDAEGDVGWVTP